MSKRTKIIAGAVVAILGVAVALIAWWSLRDEGPEAVDLETAVALMETAASDDSDDLSASEPDDGSEDATPATELTQGTGTISSTGPETSLTTSNATPATDTATTEIRCTTTRSSSACATNTGPDSQDRTPLLPESGTDSGLRRAQLARSEGTRLSRVADRSGLR